MPEMKINDIKIATEEVTNEEGNKVNVSSIEIYLKK
jgi:DNA-binding protein Alba